MKATDDKALLSLDGRVSRIRDFVNHPRKQHQLMKDKDKWDQLCSAMDAVGDAEYAVLAHRAARGNGERMDAGVLYILHYGFVQALYLQQDAVKHLCECLGVGGGDVWKSPAIKHVRDTRNDVAHPTNRGWGDARTYHGVVRASMRGESFELYSFSAAGSGSRLKKVLCEELEKMQYDELSIVLDRVIGHLEAEVKEHKDRYRSKLLEPLVSKVDYPLGKVCEASLMFSREGVWPETGPSFALGMLGAVESGVEEFTKELEEREWFPDVHEGIDEPLQSLHRVIGRLRRVFSEGGSAVVEPVDLGALARLLQGYVEELREMAADLDRDYNE